MSDPLQKVICPKCHREVEAGRFCSRCHARLAESVAAPASAAAPAVAQKVVTATPVAVSAAFAPVSPIPPATAPALHTSSARPSVPEQREDFRGEIRSAKAGIPVMMEYNAATAFIAGQQFDFQFRVKALEEIERLTLSLNLSDGGHLEETREKLHCGIPVDIRMGYTPATVGTLSACIHVKVVSGGGTQIVDYEVAQNAQFLVYSAERPSSPSSVNINVAGGSLYHGDLNLGGFSHRLGWNDIDEVVRRAASFLPLQLMVGKGTGNFLLLQGRKTVRVLAGYETVTIGRNKSCALCIRPRAASGAEDAERCQRISRFHFMIQRRQKPFGWYIMEGAVDPQGQRHSASFGTSVNGAPLSEGEALQMFADETYVVRLAVKAVPEGAVALTFRTHGNGAELSSIEVTRSDTEDISAVILRDSCPLNGLFGNVENVTVEFSEGKSFFRLPDGSRKEVCAGSRIGPAGHSICVER